MIALRDRSDGDRGDRRNRVGLGDRKDREKTVADEFEDFAAMPADFRGLGFEQRVEDRDHPLAGQPVRTLGKAAQVGGPQHRGQRHSGAAADLSGQHLRPRIGAEISAEQIVRDPILVVPVGGDREAPTDTRQIGQFVFAKPAGPIGDKKSAYKRRHRLYRHADR